MTFLPHGCWAVSQFEWTLVEASGCSNHLYCPDMQFRKGNGRMRQGRGDGHAVTGRPEHGEGSSTTIRSGLVHWCNSYPLARPIERVRSCRVDPWTGSMDTRKQVAVEPVGYPRGYVVLSLSPHYIPLHAAKRRMQRHTTPLVWPLRMRTARVVQSALRPFPAPALCRCPAPHVNTCP